MCWITKSLQYTAAPQSYDSQVCTADLDSNDIAEYFKREKLIANTGALCFNGLCYSSIGILEYNAHLGSIKDFTIIKHTSQQLIYHQITIW
jgi:hypothetical protein